MLYFNGIKLLNLALGLCDVEYMADQFKEFGLLKFLFCTALCVASAFWDLSYQRLLGSLQFGQWAQVLNWFSCGLNATNNNSSNLSQINTSNLNSDDSNFNLSSNQTTVGTPSTNSVTVNGSGSPSNSGPAAPTNRDPTNSNGNPNLAANTNNNNINHGSGPCRDSLEVCPSGCVNCPLTDEGKFTLSGTVYLWTNYILHALYLLAILFAYFGRVSRRHMALKKSRKAKEEAALGKDLNFKSMTKKRRIHHLNQSSSLRGPNHSTVIDIKEASDVGSTSAAEESSQSSSKKNSNSSLTLSDTTNVARSRARRIRENFELLTDSECSTSEDELLLEYLTKTRRGRGAYSRRPQFLTVPPKLGSQSQSSQAVNAIYHNSSEGIDLLPVDSPDNVEILSGFALFNNKKNLMEKLNNQVDSKEQPSSSSSSSSKSTAV